MKHHHYRLVATRGARLVGALCLAVFAGCDGPAEPAPSSAPMLAPTDLVDDESLAEGTIDAFGMKLPFGTSITTQTPDSIAADVPFPADSVVSYVRARVDAAQVETSAEATVFRVATVKASGSLARFLVVVKRDGPMTKLSIVRDSAATADVLPPPPAIRPVAEPSAAAEGTEAETAARVGNAERLVAPH
ncbi:MAG: hypothetical protein HOW73_25150 [Polyangiaceae bacterium]|nr:hypothetical protein [Polyangiaceae bacterium]